MSAKPKKFSDGYLKKMGGETITIRDKKGILFYDTEMTKDEFFNFYSICQEEEELWTNIIFQ